MDKNEVLMYHEKVLEAQRIAEYDYKKIQEEVDDKDRSKGKNKNKKKIYKKN